MKKSIIFLFTLIMVFLGSCTDLQEDILDETSVTGLSQNEIVEGNIAAAYAVFPNLFNHVNYFNLQEISTDEAILPFRGGTDWGDNGIFVGMHTHNFITTDPRIRDTWNQIMRGISRCVSAIDAIPRTNEPNVEAFVAEMRALKAYYSLLSLDLYGLVFVKEDPNERSVVVRGADAFNYIESELLYAENLVPSSIGPGRVSKEAIQGLLARLYLNAAVYKDRYAAQFNFQQTDMTKVIEYCDKVINSGKFRLSADYFDMFDDENHTNPELIFVYDQRAELNGHNRLAYFSLSGDQFPLANFPNANGTDGPGMTSDFYDTWTSAYGDVDPAKADPRFFEENLIIPADSCMSGPSFKMNRGILRGQQYGFIRNPNGFQRCDDGVNFRIGKLSSRTRARPDLLVNFTREIDYTTQGSLYSTGYRVLKYEFGKKSSSGRNLGDADIVLIRLADMYLMRAEAKLRGTGDRAGALADLNAVRAARTARITAPLLSEINLDILFRERGFEFYWEMLRRTDMIRFGKFEDPWTEKTDSDPLKRIFPIPQTALDGASNIPGYLEQNPGY
ncbi:RagB/SusD family nutrient uptake outer membrane protein [Aquiflexum sp. LQ15W]|uniref:RagB/SusD family nutrient uptake outer membrane protein n=1 Tax=Cognataquiflexum nitidum TaxID=2922272 RepID=UPI001F12C264|nr:RagB/SusD family nutrient uptake outer membrane protein [Cognataquiflexum nitidum]MCH6201002.1 RagB/SusD family nutrient uptake outer membrane protein [Cognataquiflexum nitidum]